MKRERVGVIGVGPIGGILAAHLAKSGVDVVAVDVIEPLIKKIKEGGIRVTGPATEKTYGEILVRLKDATTSLDALKEAETVFVCTKTTVLDSVVKSLKRVWQEGKTLISFQNGIDPEESLSEVAGRENTLRVVVNYAGNAVEDGVYKMNWFNPPNYVGALTKEAKRKAEKIAKLLTSVKLLTEAVDDIKKYAFEKTALNATLCPICALTGQTMGAAMANEDSRRLVVEILKEARKVGEAMGLKFEHSLDDWLKYLSAGGPHKPSLAVDLEAGRKTEIDFMNGKIVEYGRKFGIPTPYNDSMLWSVRARENQILSSKER
ncbi:MAG: 2-dehydropantoate 2-reductase [Planctomycetota bacterium]|nr:2-dehydropantoate 2-reductase [Planctomycetota bacterium]